MLVATSNPTYLRTSWKDIYILNNNLKEGQQIENSRLFYIDNLKAFLVMLVILFHVAMTFGSIDGWYFYEAHNSYPTKYLMYYFVAVNQAFFMGLFFMLSAYFIPASYRKKGPFRFLTDKLKRLGIPLAIYILLVVPLLNYQYDIRYQGLHGSFWNFYEKTILQFKSLGAGPLWFALILLLLSIMYVLVNLFIKKKNPEAFRKPLKPPGIKVISLAILILLVITFIVRLFFPIDQWYFFLRITFLDIAHIPQYISLFFIGILCYENKWLKDITRSMGIIFLAVFIVSILIWPIIMIAGGIKTGNFDVFFGGLTWQSLVYSAWEAVVCISASIALPWVFRQKFNFGQPLVRRIAGSSFIVYLIHTPLLVGLGYLLLNLSIHPLLKFCLEGVAGIIISYTLASVINLITHSFRPVKV